MFGAKITVCINGIRVPFPKFRPPGARRTSYFLLWYHPLERRMPLTRASKRKRISEDGLKNVEKQEEEEAPAAASNETTASKSSSAKNIKENAPLVVFAHGAGAPSTSEWMIRWKNMLAKALNAIEVLTFDYPYISGGKRKAPPKAEKLVDFHSDVVKEAVAKYPNHPLILVGKSMGSRVSCMVASGQDIDASAVVCLGYPLKGINGAVRDEILLQLRVPIMFVQGSKDGLCPLNKLEAVRKKMTCANELHAIEGGDHSFKIGKKHLQLSETTQEEAEDLAVQAVATFVANFGSTRELIVFSCLGKSKVDDFSG
ncbi:PREDICTED: KAT8 regulatory NSL complex subunit 3 [Ipomoea nil]|uniref:KAT8 regulatory NSL complex subunit 3 n=1 Tax=Ipomoea nil TaxID=35883 RepID=UPI000900F600|nr:PREDICTED: KAT8 regulatory NSL complex subunit 3 [Ipomoea nil]